MLLKRILISVPVFLVIDAIWLSIMVPLFYAPQLGSLLSDTPNMIAAAIFYVGYGVGIGVLSRWSPQDLVKAFGFGVLLGLMTYGTYDLTNLALIDGWPVAMTIADMIWGAFITGATVCVVTSFTRKKIS